MLESIKTELDGNERSLEDFPEVAHAIQSLDGIANRASGQLLNGQGTHIGWTAREIFLPTIPANAAILRMAGLTGRIRGMTYKRPVSAIRWNRLFGHSLDASAKRAVPTNHCWSSISPGRQVLSNQGSIGP